LVGLIIKKSIMARIKGSKMTEEAKIAMRAKREANKLGRESAFVTIWNNLKFLEYDQLETLATEINRLVQDKREDERLMLIKQKEIIESRINALKK